MVEKTSGERFCTVKDVIIDSKENRVYALVCKESLIKRSKEAIPYSSVISLSQNYVLITRKDSAVIHREIWYRNRHCMSYEFIIGKLVINSRGEILGIIRDLLIDAESGAIKAYELSEGYIDDIVKGRRIIELDKNCSFTEHSMVIKENSG